MALALGRTVSELERSLTSSEFNEWMAFYEMEPFGPKRDNLHAGQVASLIYNVHRRKGSAPLGPGEFMFRDPHAKAEEETVSFLSALESLAKPKNEH